MNVKRRRPIAAILALSLLLSWAGHAAAPSNSEIFRVVRIKGRRVHLRNGIPPQLTHENVVRHLRDREVLVADRIGYGIGHDGSGTEEWMHLIDPATGECGWVNATYIEAVLATPEPEEPAKESENSKDAPVPATLPGPSNQPIHDTPPPDALLEQPTPLTNVRKMYGNDLQFIANLAAICALLVSLLMAQQQKGQSPASSVVGAPAAVAGQTPVQPLGSAGESTASRTPNFTYVCVDGVALRLPNPRQS